MKTPRTDAERRRLKKAKAYPPDPVSAEFARQIESELAAMTALADRLASGLDDLTVVIGIVPIKGNLKALHTAFDRACQALTDYEAHKQKHHE